MRKKYPIRDLNPEPPVESQVFYPVRLIGFVKIIEKIRVYK